ncbi:MAG: hypothetical protein O3C40_05600 [Planctomycetota bacterium]|nr:hypothetical protein [Planctomycetota bacterium]
MWQCGNNGEIRRLLLLVAFALSFVSTPARGDELPEMAEIVSALTEWKEAFANVRVVWEQHDLKATDDSSEMEVASTSTFEWLSADHGIDLFDHRHSAQFRTLEVWNGPQDFSFAADYQGDVLSELKIAGLGGSGRPETAKSRTPFTGVYFSSSALWLGDALRKWSGWEVKGVTDVDGHACVHLMAPWFGESVWLDPERDYLVRRTRRPHSEEADAHEFTVDEFEHADNGRWFPKRGTQVLFNQNPPHVHQRWVVTDLSVNDELDPSRFGLPSLEVGVSVTDMRVGRVYRVEHEGDRRDIEQKISAQAIANLKAAKPAARSPPFAWLRLPAILIGASVVLLAAALWFSKRRT